MFFYDLGLLGLMVATDGAVSQSVVAALVQANPAGLYRTTLLVQLSGATALEDLGLTVVMPGSGLQAAIWTAWLVVPLGIGAALMGRRRAVTS